MTSLFSSSKKWDAATDFPDLHGRVALVTGGNSGIGFAAVTALALHGAKVYLAARSETKAKGAIEELYAKNSQIQKGSVLWLPLVLGDIKSVVKAVDAMKGNEKSLDILINNAGLASDTFETTDAGFELTMAVCHVGHFLLTQGLLPLLKVASSRPGSAVRVVTFSSAAQREFFAIEHPFAFSTPSSLAYPGTDDPAKYTSYMAKLRRYALAKLANILFASELQRRCDAADIHLVSTSTDPGIVATEGGAGAMPAAWVGWLFKKFAASPEKGVASTLFAAVSPDIDEEKGVYKGQYLSQAGRMGRLHVKARDEGLGKDLWNTTRAAVDTYMMEKGLGVIDML